MPELKVNEELLKCIKKMQVQTLDRKRIPFQDVLQLPESTPVFVILFCEENPKFKLKKEHYAKTIAGEAKLYIQLGIQEEENELC